jgi:cytosine/adenosine deaminase-related metal-dependent hydrolase
MRAHVALGTDSRITGSRDLLDEIRVANRLMPVTPAELLTMVTSGPAALLRQSRAGKIAIGGQADLVVVPPMAADAGSALLKTKRRDLQLVAVAGRPLVADPEFAPVFAARRVTARPLVLDEAPKVAESGLVRRIAGCPIVEPGVSVP